MQVPITLKHLEYGTAVRLVLEDLVKNLCLSSLLGSACHFCSHNCIYNSLSTSNQNLRKWIGWIPQWLGD